jgi:hypothetical protein
MKRVEALENYAAQVRKADAARMDWKTAQQVASINDKYRDLIARTAAAEHAVADLTKDSLNAERAAKALSETLASAVPAVETLVLD